MNFFKLAALEDVRADVIEYQLKNENDDLTYIINYVEQGRGI